MFGLRGLSDDPSTHHRVTNRLPAGRVFVAGGLPDITYNPRTQLGLEEMVQDYLDEHHRVLSISGPTKTGKTVLVRRMLRDMDAIRVSGGDVKTIADLWINVGDHLGLHTVIESSRQTTDTDARTVTGEVQIPAIGKLSKSGAENTATAITDRSARNRPIEVAARNALRESMAPLVIDDFHYITVDVQTDIVRSLKDLVFDGVPVIVIAVPHRAYDVIRVEREMTGRVEQMKIGFWSNDELRGIASTGFSALNVIDEEGIIGNRLAEESFASPHLMQDFCLQVVKGSGYRERQETPALLHEPQWQAFFEDRSTAASKTAFDMLARGPRQRTDRKPRQLKNGMVVDIYGAVLMAIGRTGPLTSITYETLRAAMREVAGEEAPRGQEITRILDEMSKIARDQIDGEPVVDYDSKLTTLHISDPYFAFFLKWRAAWELAERSSPVQAMFPEKAIATKPPTPVCRSPTPKLEPVNPRVRKFKGNQRRRRKGRR